MNIWLNYNNDEKLVLLQQTAEAKKIVEQAIEKDWWVNALLMALSRTSCTEFLQFKGGTSLSKAWGLINRFSEDIDLAISRSFFNLPDETSQQRTAIRRKAFHYIKEILIDELKDILSLNRISGFEIELVTKNSSDMIVVVVLKYNSILPVVIDYLLPVVKIEFSAMSLDEPFEKREIETLIHSEYPEIDNEMKCLFKSVLPERTFLEKIFLLHEEYQKENPRTERMSRHLYDLEKMMDSPFAESALQNTDLYKIVLRHRQKFNNIQGIDYQTHYPDQIQICPPEKLINSWKSDYENLQESFIYDKSKKTFSELVDRMIELTDRIRRMPL
ncbi:nucleotidyl transferase AbiEii/AbiGii toxin family protein [Bacteroidales bacterium OttesenSCG-928-B11]|nr:nucleotidyl transferase AbiEii/AbiGii toxin family protein [Bacteroidales bacterium OttesenSCG-928-E04]MDL2311264.1 nucleotidyl transferase AbiEii/AbiGii toxin family protein [Bacteroidales bacterium OttesenSCG-928-B11]